jgi:hypothetical protein
MIACNLEVQKDVIMRLMWPLVVQSSEIFNWDLEIAVFVQGHINFHMVSPVLCQWKHIDLYSNPGDPPLARDLGEAQNVVACLIV